MFRSLTICKLVAYKEECQVVAKSFFLQIGLYDDVSNHHGYP